MLLTLQCLLLVFPYLLSPQTRQSEKVSNFILEDQRGGDWPRGPQGRGDLQDPAPLVPSQDHTVPSPNAWQKHSVDISSSVPHREAGRIETPALPGQGKLDCSYEVSSLGTARPVASGEREYVLSNPEVALAWSCFRRVCVLASELGEIRESRGYVCVHTHTHTGACTSMCPAHVWVCACTKGGILKSIPEKVMLILKEGSNNGRISDSRCFQPEDSGCLVSVSRGEDRLLFQRPRPGHSSFWSKR